MPRKKYTRVALPGTARISLKGEALLCAVDAGLVQESANGSGYNIGPFLKFWEEFSLLLPNKIKEQPDDTQDVVEMVEKYRN